MSSLALATTSATRQSIAGLRPLLFLSAFQPCRPRYQGHQEHLLDWLVQAHARSGDIGVTEIRTLFARHGASPEAIAFRGHALNDFAHHDWERMRLFHPAGTTIVEKSAFFAEATAQTFDNLYATDLRAPKAIVHVTCTGYGAPSAAQRLVSHKGWHDQTRVTHAHHMGCYAAHPALRIALGETGIDLRRAAAVDIVHTELCSLHFDPRRHTPEQIVIQSLFADGAIRYQTTAHAPEGLASLALLAMHEEIVPQSEGAMSWGLSPLSFTMTLGKTVPMLLAHALPSFLECLCRRAGLSYALIKDEAFFAVHPGGPKIIDLAESCLHLRPDQTVASRAILRRHGNMSSATLPHIWNNLLRDPAVPSGALVLSLAAGPGLTLSGALLRKQ